VIEIRDARRGAAFKAFVEFPYERYRDLPQWVPPLRCVERRRLDPRHNPFFAHGDAEFFLAMERGHVAGRIAAIDDRRHHDVHRDGAAAFGFFEASSAAAARALLDRVEFWTLSRDRVRLRGPLNPSLNDMAGLLVEGFDRPPAVMMPYNPPEYAEWLEAAGFEKAKDLWALGIDLTSAEPFARLERQIRRLRQAAAVRVRALDERRFADEVEALSDVYARAWEDNWGFVPPTPAERAHLAHELRRFGDMRFVLCAEVAGRIVGFAAAVPDLNQVLAGTDGRLTPRTMWRLARRRRLINRGRLLLCGVLPAYRRRGVLPLLVAELFARARAAGGVHVECSWVLEDNLEMIRPILALGGRREKTYRIYEKLL
jgi:GNAT superfamily N-acetyltransferase